VSVDYNLMMVCLLLFLAHLAIVASRWMEVRLRPMMLRIGLLNKEAEWIHKTALKYSGMGLVVPPDLLKQPSSIPKSEARRIETRLSIELTLILVTASMPPGLLLMLN
jgi:hypothetical protein